MIHRIFTTILFLTCFSLVVGKAEQPPLDPDKGIRFHPVQQNIEGWTVHVEPVLLEEQEGRQALRMLADHLHRITILLPKEPLKKMRGLEIWVEKNHPSLKSMQYHPSKQWLIGHAHDPRLSKKVHIPVARHLLSRQQLLKHPAVVLHELAHAYHDQILGFNDAAILKAFNKAKEAGSYEKVLLYTGKTVRHYALTDHKEYFAEGTEAYFYRNDFFPFVRAELELHDPDLHQTLEAIWGSAR